MIDRAGSLSILQDRECNKSKIYYLLGSRHYVKYFMGDITIPYHNGFTIEGGWVLKIFNNESTLTLWLQDDGGGRFSRQGHQGIGVAPIGSILTAGMTT